MADIQVNYAALQRASQQCTRFRTAFNETGTRVANNMNQTANSALVSEASDAVRSAGTRFSTAFERTGATLDRLAQWLQQVQQDYSTRAQESRVGFEGINPGGA
jgi:hypothetical protein